MHAPLRQPDQNLHHTWRGGANGVHYFDREYAGELIERYNLTGDQESLNQLLQHVEPLAKSILEYRCTTKHESMDELLSRIRIKVWKSARLYDASKGSAFSFIAKVISSTAASTIGEAWRRESHYCELGDNDPAAGCDLLTSREAIADLEHRIRQVKTPCSDPYELEAQQWLVASFIDADFGLKRCDAANAMMTVYGLGHAQSRRLFDLTLVAIRRELLTGRRLKPVNPRSLVQTRSAAIIQFARFLSENEFTRLRC